MYLGWLSAYLACRKSWIQSQVPHNTKSGRDHMPSQQHLRGGSERQEVNLGYVVSSCQPRIHGSLRKKETGKGVEGGRKGKREWSRVREGRCCDTCI